MSYDPGWHRKSNIFANGLALMIWIGLIVLFGVLLWSLPVKLAIAIFALIQVLLFLAIFMAGP